MLLIAERSENNYKIYQYNVAQYNESSILDTYSLFQKIGYTFAIVYSSKCVTIFLKQTLFKWK